MSRHLTGEQRDRAEDLEAEFYRSEFDRLDDEARAEYESEFGPEFLAMHPYKTNITRIHEQVMRKINQRR